MYKNSNFLHEFANFLGQSPSPQQTLFPPVNIFENTHELCIQAFVPGLCSDDIKLTLVPQKLILEGKPTPPYHDGHILHQERYYGAFKRSLPLPQHADTTHLIATLENGVLNITMPLTHPVAQAPTPSTKHPLIPRLRPHVDVLENEQNCLLFIDLPGVQPNSVHLSLHQSHLSISATTKRFCHPATHVHALEFIEACYRITFTLSSLLNPQSLKSSCHHGIYQLLVPKKRRPV